MAIEINIPNSANFEQTITLPTQRRITIRGKYITRGDTGWVIDVINAEGGYLFRGYGLNENTSVGKGSSYNEFNYGSLVCLKKTNTTEQLNRDNLGFNKDFGLFYIGFEELE